jgi:hypothetical protein
VPIALDPLAAEVAYELAPLLAQDDDSNGNVGAHFIAALNGPLEVIAEAVREDEDERDGFAVFLDLDRAPAIALAWLAQFKGVRATPGLAEADSREEVRNAEGLHRGTTAALVQAGQRSLTGTKTVRVLERVGGAPYALTVITRTSETPDPAVTLAAFMAAKRIGILLTHVVSDAPIIDEGTRTINAAAGNIDTATLANIT